MVFLVGGSIFNSDFIFTTFLWFNIFSSFPILNLRMGIFAPSHPPDGGGGGGGGESKQNIGI